MVSPIRTLILAATVTAVFPAVSVSSTTPSEPRGSDRAEGNNAQILDSALHCLALNIYHEARSESERGQIAVAAVTLNRVKSKRFPNSVCGVVTQGGERLNRCQFSWWCDGRSDRPTDSRAWKRALRIARESLLGLHRDPTKGALYYHTKRVRPTWARTLYRSARIGNHLFYRPAAKGRSVRIASSR